MANTKKKVPEKKAKGQSELSILKKELAESTKKTNSIAREIEKLLLQKHLPRLKKKYEGKFFLNKGRVGNDTIQTYIYCNKVDKVSVYSAWGTMLVEISGWYFQRTKGDKIVIQSFANSRIGDKLLEISSNSRIDDELVEISSQDFNKEFEFNIDIIRSLRAMTPKGIKKTEIQKTSTKSSSSILTLSGRYLL